MKAPTEVKRIVLAARMYFEEGMDQAAVAAALGVSRPTVSRLLREARAMGIVHIRVVDPLAASENLAAALRERFALRQAVVVPSDPEQSSLGRDRIGAAAARILERTLQDGEIVGVGWGRTLRAVVEALAPQRQVPFVAVPLLGGLGQVAPSFQVHELAGRLVQAFGGTIVPLYLPAIVPDDRMRRRLLASADAELVTANWDRLTSAVIGIGNVDFDSEMRALFAPYLDAATQERLRAANAVGDLCMRFYDANGRPIGDGLRGVVAIELTRLRGVRNVIAVAGGTAKAAAILGALRGGYIGSLVTDELAARAILAFADATPEPAQAAGGRIVDR
jgi:DNA-binding transcriptional regulator LsrR (DeoR family)